MSQHCDVSAERTSIHAAGRDGYLPTDDSWGFTSSSSQSTSAISSARMHHGRIKNCIEFPTSVLIVKSSRIWDDLIWSGSHAAWRVEFNEYVCTWAPASGDWRLPSETATAGPSPRHLPSPHPTPHGSRTVLGSSFERPRIFYLRTFSWCIF